MSQFSEKCKEYLQVTGTSVYQLSILSGLERTSLQRMVTGKRLPELSFVRQFCEALRINPMEREQLLDLYRLEKCGKKYANFKYIRELLQYLCAAQDPKADDMLTVSAAEGSRYIPSGFSTTVERQFMDFLHMFLGGGTDEICYTNFPPENRLLLHTLCQLEDEQKRQFRLFHLFPLLQNPQVFANCIHNLEVFQCALKITRSGMEQYRPYYYYNTTGGEDLRFQVFPYYFMTGRRLFLVSSDFSSCTAVDDKNLVQKARGQLQQFFKNSTCLFHNINTAKEIAEIYFNLNTRNISPRYTLEPHPCISLMTYGLELLEALYPPTAQSDGKPAENLFEIGVSVTGQAEAMFSSDTDYKNFFTAGGLRQFVETGKFPGLYSYHQIPATCEQRSRSLQHFLQTQLGNQNCKMLREETLANTNVHLEVFSDYSLFLGFLMPDDSFLCLTLRESSIGEAFLDFFESLEQNEFCCDYEETVEYVRTLLAEIQQ